MGKKKKPVPVESEKEPQPIVINPNTIRIRDLRGINLSGCGLHRDKKKLQNKYMCRRSRGKNNTEI